MKINFVQFQVSILVGCCVIVDCILFVCFVVAFFNSIKLILYQMKCNEICAMWNAYVEKEFVKVSSSECLSLFCPITGWIFERDRF